MRAAQSQANNAATQAGNTAGEFQTSAQSENQSLTPFLQRELGTEHEFSPDQLNQLLTAAGAGTGGATGSLTSQAELEQARTRNSASNAPVLDAVARSAQQQMAKTSEGVAAQDVEGAKQLNQEAAGGLEKMYGVNTDAALKAMGLQNQDIQTEIDASKTGWMQNLTGLLGALNGAGAKGVTI